MSRGNIYGLTVISVVWFLPENVIVHLQPLVIEPFKLSVWISKSLLIFELDYVFDNNIHTTKRTKKHNRFTRYTLHNYIYKYICLLLYRKMVNTNNLQQTIAIIL